MKKALQLLSMLLIVCIGLQNVSAAASFCIVAVERMGDSVTLSGFTDGALGQVLVASYDDFGRMTALNLADVSGGCWSSHFGGAAATRYSAFFTDADYAPLSRSCGAGTAAVSCERELREALFSGNKYDEIRVVGNVSISTPIVINAHSKLVISGTLCAASITNNGLLIVERGGTLSLVGGSLLNNSSIEVFGSLDVAGASVIGGGELRRYANGAFMGSVLHNALSLKSAAMEAITEIELQNICKIVPDWAELRDSDRAVYAALLKNKYVSPYADNRLRAYEPRTRGDVAMALCLVEQTLASNGSPVTALMELSQFSISDVFSDMQCFRAVSHLVNSGVLILNNNGCFRPNDFILESELTEMLGLFCDKLFIETEPLPPEESMTLVTTFAELLALCSGGEFHGVIGINASLEIPSDGDVVVPLGIKLVVLGGCTLTNFGSFAISSPGDDTLVAELELRSGAKMINHTYFELGGILFVASGSVLDNNGEFISFGTITNEGTITGNEIIS